MSWDNKAFEERMKRMRDILEEDIGRDQAFQDEFLGNNFYDDGSDWFGDAFRYAHAGQQQKGPTKAERPIYHQCLKDAIEYFESSTKIPISNKRTRERLTEPVKKRIVEFLKNRKKYYEENGLLIIDEKGEV